MRKITFVASGYGSWPLPKLKAGSTKPADIEKLIQAAVEKRLPIEVERALFKQAEEQKLEERRAEWRAQGEAAFAERHAREQMERMEKEKADLEAKLDAWDKQNPGHNVFEELLKGKPLEVASAPKYPKWYKPMPD
jgi:hypothetical protein